MSVRRTFFAAAAAFALLTAPLSAGEPAVVPAGPLAEAYLKLLQDRVRHLDIIHDYGVAGEFPKNEDFPGQQVPYFVDVHHTHCAVANLMLKDREIDLIQTIAKTNNHIRVREIKDGPALAWILRSGFTQEEMARIQPSYNWRRPSPLPKPFPPSPLPQPEPDPQSIAEQQRVRDHFKRVEEELRASTYPSLEKALNMLLPSIQESAKTASLGFAVVPAPTSAEEKGKLKISNKADRPIAIRITFFDAKGNAVGPRLPGDSPFRDGKGTVEAGKEVEVTYDCRQTWVFVEWSSNAELPAKSVEVASPFVAAAGGKTALATKE